MRHRTKSIKFHSGKDSNDMIIKKLLFNFLTHPKMVTTEKKGKVLKQYLDIILSKAKERTESNKNYLLHYFPQQNVIDVLFSQVGPSIAKIAGGYTKLTHLTQRDSDGAYMVSVEWAHPIVVKWPDTVAEKKAKVTKAASVKESKTTASRSKKESEVVEEKK